MATDIKISTNSKKQLFLSIGLFVFIVIISIFTYFYKSSLESSIEEQNTKITSLESNISKLNSDKNISVYNLVEINKSYIADLDKKSDINNIVTNIKGLSKDFGINFSSFYYKNGNITLSAFAAPKDKDLAYKKVAKFIAHFRGENKEIFTLGHISNFNGRDTLKFNVNFNLK